MRLRYNLLKPTLNADLSNIGTTITFAAALQEGGVNIPTIVAPNFLSLTIENETMYLTAYTAGATSGTVLRGQEDTIAAAHVSGLTIRNTPTKMDFGNGLVRVAASNSSNLSKAAADYICDGSNDEVVFQHIIDTYGTTSGGLLIIEAAFGTYSIDAQSDVDCVADVVIRGNPDVRMFDGAKPLIDKQTTGDFSIFAVTGSTMLTSFVGLRIENNLSNGAITSALIEIGASAEVLVDRCWVYQFGSTAAACVELVGNSAKVEIIGSDVESTSNALKLGSHTGLSIVARHSYLNSSVAAAISGTSISSGADLLFDDCWIDGGGTDGLRIDGDTGSTPMPTVRLWDCRVESDAGEAVYLTDIARLEVRGGRYEAVGGSLFRLSNVDEGIINSPTSAYSDRHGIWLLDCEDILIDAPQFDGYGQQTDNTYSGIILDGDTNRCTVVNPKLRSQATNKALYGVRVDDATCDNNTILGGDLVGSSKTVGNEFSDAGTATVSAVEPTLLGEWFQDNVVASQAAVVLLKDATHSETPTVRGGSVTGIVVYSNAARLAGTLTVDVTINGVVTGLTAVIDGTNTTVKATTQAQGLDKFTAGQRIGVKITTDVAWLPITADIQAEVEVVYDGTGNRLV